ncbi:uncharacterized protein B0T23DRAFT_423654 [Neurospora hispaniola]|uniref:Uncharacterized protein n=1 Tax=Neurospora hispaniola TaxID=588809 RepID=A0AAJ0MMG0_9PEZI|nr:hypothetical protein B0T23DRAFT_423654 [Neurospora hispaniola]
MRPTTQWQDQNADDVFFTGDESCDPISRPASPKAEGHSESRYHVDWQTCLCLVTLFNTVQAVLTRCQRSSQQERKQAQILTTTEDCRKQYNQYPESLVLQTRFSRFRSLNRIHDLLDGYSAGGFLASMRSSHRGETNAGSLMMADQLAQLIAHRMGPFRRLSLLLSQGSLVINVETQQFDCADMQRRSSANHLTDATLHTVRATLSMIVQPYHGETESWGNVTVIERTNPSKVCSYQYDEIPSSQSVGLYEKNGISCRWEKARRHSEWLETAVYRYKEE